MDSAKSIKRQIAGLAQPAEIAGIDVDFGSDTTGAPAAWIYLHVRDDIPKGLIGELSRFAQRVQLEILRRNEGRPWPYVRLSSPLSSRELCRASGNSRYDRPRHAVPLSTPDV